jgi:RNA polymerase sigma-70 factor (sigma-E family)
MILALDRLLFPCNLGRLRSVFPGEHLEEPMKSAADEEFTAYVAASAVRLRRMAYLLCGDWLRAEDELQAALVKLYLAWHRLRSPEALDSFVRKTVVRQLIDEHRRPWRRERPQADLPELAVVLPLPLEDRLAVRAALAQVPPRQRAVLVLRFYEECDVAETARLIGCSEGTVKSQAARGLARLRELLTAADWSAAFTEG